ncbi:hypothetical protein ABQ366_17820 [Serratia fonticola]|uniref:hypothetical protein n=1 Tax=Serratia fonticola TaxID=47917 RepID=UPI003AB006DA
MNINRRKVLQLAIPFVIGAQSSSLLSSELNKDNSPNSLVNDKDDEFSIAYSNNFFSRSYFVRGRNFTHGGLLSNSRQVFFNEENGLYYQYIKIIPSGGLRIPSNSKPTMEWLCVGKATMGIGQHSLYDFGCRDDNGLTDNRELIQLAVDYAIAAQSELFINTRNDQQWFGVSSFNPDRKEKVCIVITSVRNLRINGGRDRNSSIRYIGNESGHSLVFLCSPKSDWGMTFTSLGLSAGNKLDFVVYGANVWYAQNTIAGGCYEDAKLDGIHVSMYMSNFTRVFCNNNGRDGFSFGGPDSEGGFSHGAATSLNLNDCWSRGSGRYGYFSANELWYSNWASLGCDGVPKSKTLIAYVFNNAKGVTLTSVGAEKCLKLLKIYSFRGVDISGIQLSGMGADDKSELIDACIELVSGFNATISGYAPIRQFERKYRYDLAVTGAKGNESVVVLDNSIDSSRTIAIKSYENGFYKYPEIIYFLNGLSPDRGMKRVGNTLFADKDVYISPASLALPDQIIRRECVVRCSNNHSCKLMRVVGGNYTALISVVFVPKTDRVQGCEKFMFIVNGLGSRKSIEKLEGGEPIGWSVALKNDTLLLASDYEAEFFVNLTFSTTDSGCFLTFYK